MSTVVPTCNTSTSTCYYNIINSDYIVFHSCMYVTLHTIDGSALTPSNNPLRSLTSDSFFYHNNIVTSLLI